MLNRIFKNKKNRDFFVSCFDVDHEELILCQQGDNVNLWYPEDKSFVNVYRSGTIAGQGKLTQITGNKSNMVIDHLKRGNQIDASISIITKLSFRMFCKVTSYKQILLNKENKIQSIKSEINKSYKPKSASYKLYTKTLLNYEISDVLHYKESDLEIDINDDTKLEYHRIKLYLKDEYIGDISAQTIVRKLIRAYNSGYFPIIKIGEIKKEDKVLILSLKIKYIKQPVPNKDS